MINLEGGKHILVCFQTEEPLPEYVWKFALTLH